MVRSLFSPQSIVVVGVSRQRGKLGHDLFHNIATAYKGQLYGLNPKGGKVAGKKLLKSVADLPLIPDLALVMIPAASVPDSVRELAELGVKNFVILSAGFREVGAKGGQLEQRLYQLVRHYQIRILGPNCLGFINAELGLNATFASWDGFRAEADVALISQSGAMAVALLDMAREQGVSLRYMVSVGNRMDVDEVDVLRFVSQDFRVKVVAVYSEALARPAEFFRLCYRLRRRLPVVLLKGGATASGLTAAKSHTGSLSQPARLIATASGQSGVIQADSIRQLFASVQALRFGPRPRARQSLTIVTNAGGPGIIAADATDRANLKLSHFTPTTVKKLEHSLPPAVQVTNPLDLLGDADVSRFRRSLKLLLDGGHTVVLIVTPQTMTPVTELTEWLVSRPEWRDSVVPVFLGGTHMQSAAGRLRHAGFAVFTYPEEAIRHLSAVIRAAGPVSLLATAVQVEATRTQTLDPIAAARLLRGYRLPFVPGKVLQRLSQLSKVKQFPIAMKLLSPTIVHKAVSGAVRLHLSNTAEAAQAWHELRQLVSQPDDFAGMLVQPMARPGLELFIGAKRDRQFGTIITYGLGGNQVELYDDLVSFFSPVNRSFIEESLAGLRSRQLIEQKDCRVFIHAIMEVSRLMRQKKSIVELDINPFILYAQGASIVDVRIVCNT